MDGHRAALALVLAGAAALRLWGLDFGLPNTSARPDESVLLHRALAIAAGDLHPHFFNHPSLQLYLVAALCGAYYVAERLLGAVAGPEDFAREFLCDPSGLYLVGRLLTAVVGTATVALVYRLGRSLGGGAGGVSAALVLGGAFLHVRDSHFLTVDVPATFWVTAAMASLCSYAERGRRGSLLLGALGAGLAASTKYSAVLFLPAVVAAALLAGENRLRRAALCLVVWGGALLAGSPYIALDPAAFWRDFSFEWHHFGRGHGADLGAGWLYHLSFSLRHGLGWPALLASLLGLAILALRRRPQDLVVLVGFASYYAVAGSGASVFARYALPLLPLLCAAGGACVARFTAGRVGAALAVGGLLVLPSAATSVAHDRLLAQTDTRVLAARWLESHLADGDTVVFTGSDFGQPQLRPTRGWLQERLQEVQRVGEPGRRIRLALQVQGCPPAPTFYPVSLRLDNPQGLGSVWPPEGVDGLRRRGARWLVVQRHPLAYASAPQILESDLAQLRPVAEFDPFLEPAERGAYDPIDAYYAPMHRQEAVSRPGPRLEVYQLGAG